jgi:putative ABC transport system permease protein
MVTQAPGFTAVVILTLALGIGANTSIFSVVDTVVLRPLPYESPDELFMVFETEREGDRGSVSYPNFEDWREQNRVFEEIAVFRRMSFTLLEGDEPERVDGARVSAAFFPLLRIEPALGRSLQPDDDLAGAENVCLLGHGIWQCRFGGDPDLVGNMVNLDGTLFTVVGILPPGFGFPIAVSEADVWTPTALDSDFLAQRGAHLPSAFARLKSGRTLTQAQTEMDTIANRLEEQYPNTNAGRGVRLVPLHEEVVGDIRTAAFVLLGAAGLVLLIACANIASLLLARSSGREQELAVRAALGAGRGRLVRQLLTEGVLMAFVGGVFGLLLAYWGKEALVAALPSDLPRVAKIAVDERVLCFTLVISLLAGLLFGMAPAMQIYRMNAHESLKVGDRTQNAPRAQRLRNVVTASEVALALVLLIGAGLMMRSFHRLVNVDMGFDPEKVLTFQMSVPFAGYKDPASRAELYGQVLERVSAIPGVQSAGAGLTVPLAGASVALSFEIVGRSAATPGEELTARHSSVTAGFFRTMGIPLLKGRFFTEQDKRSGPVLKGRLFTEQHDRSGPGAAIINEAMARRFWPNEDPLGQHLKHPIAFGEGEPESYEIVGIVGEVRHGSLEAAGQPCYYFSSLQQTWPSAAFVLRTSVDPLSLVPAVRSEIAAITREEAAYGFKTMGQFLAETTASRRIPMLLLTVFAAVALALAAVGIYGTLSCSVAQLTREIGVRMALGANSLDVFRLVLRQGLILTAIGLGIGLIVSTASARLLSGLLYGVGAIDPITFVGVSVVLIGVAFVACLVPARRATKLTPMVALRSE